MTHEDIYQRLAKVLDTLPNGFPASESGVEIKMLKKIFTPEQADLFCDLRLTFETPEQIAERTGRSLDGLADLLKSMRHHGQIQGIKIGEQTLFRMLPWIFGIYEMQLGRLDKEFAEMNEAYHQVFGRQFFTNKPQQFRIVPIEKEISGVQEALPYDKVSSIIENGQSYMVQDCICKKEKRLLDRGCDYPMEVCLAIAPIPGAFDKYPHGRALSKEEAYALLDRAEEVGLVHLTHNIASGHFYICNCCGCCCAVLAGINKFGIAAADVINSAYVAQIDPDLCIACGTCADERCQVRAIKEKDGFYEVLRHGCIGCGLCVTTCPTEAARLVPKLETELVSPPEDEKEWFEARGRFRGIDFSAYE